MSKIVLVSGFFDIGRDSFASHPRTTEQYFAWFKRWARMHNDLIVFCENAEVQQRIVSALKRVKKHGSYQVINLGPKESYCSAVFSRMKQIEVSPAFKAFRISKSNCEDQASYCYVMFLKYYLLNVAMQYVDKANSSDKYLAWIDFGFEHGGELYGRSSQYNFEWQFPFFDRIVMSLVAPLDERPISTIAADTRNYCVAGALVVVPFQKVELFVSWVNDSYDELLAQNIIDDDQTILLDVYRKHSVDISLVPSRFFLALNQFGGRPRPKSARIDSFVQGFKGLCVKLCPFIRRVHRK